MDPITALTERPDFHAAIADAILARAADVKEASATRARLDRQILTRPGVATALALELAAAVALNPTIAQRWRERGDFADGDVAYEVEQQLAQRAESAPLSWARVAAGSTMESTVQALTLGWARAALDVLSDPNRTSPALRKLLRERVTTAAGARAIAQETAHLVLATSILAPYEGDLTDVPAAEIVNAIAAVLTTLYAEG